MFCTNCGKEVNSNFCTNCGTKVGGNTGSVTLSVVRPKSMVGVAVAFTVYVDGTNIGKLKNNTTLTYDVTPGEHTIIIKSLEKEVKQNILVQENTNSVEVVVGIKMGLIAGRAVLKEVNYK